MFRTHFKLRPTPLSSLTNAQYIPRPSQYFAKRHKGSSRLPRKPTGNTLALELYKQNGYSKRKGVTPSKGDRSRLNIVSESLCDDVIERLASSLKRHTSCDIIDVNPGVGLWSSKLHEAIKPRTHILMEPDTDLYMPFLQPLLDEPGSTYKLIPESGIIWDNLNKLESENYLPNQKLLPTGDARLEKHNDSLLFIANLGYYPNKIYKGFPSITALMIHQLLTAVRAHSIFQGYGLVRMLVWMRDREKKVVFPRVISQRRKFSVEAEISCENIFEIAGSDELASICRREHALDLEGARAVMSKMARDSIKTPEARIGTLQNEVAQKPNSTVDTGSGVIRPFLKELEDMEARYARGEFCAYYDRDGKPVYAESGQQPKGSRGAKRTPEWCQLLQLRYRLSHANKKTDKLDHFLTEYDSILSEQTRLQGLDIVDAQRERDQLQERLFAWKANVERHSGHLESLLWQRIDDRRALRQDPPILLWDRREVEPLKVFENDFFPQHEMCLLDFQPKSLWPVFQGKKISNYDYFDFIIAGLYTNPTHSITRGLKALAPGADEWIIPKCPSLTNTAKGGVIDLEQLSIRTLNQDMLRELIEAWMDWPFRPTKAEMMVRAGPGGTLPGGDDDLDINMPGLLM